MAKTLAEAQERLQAEEVSPFRTVLERLQTLTIGKSAPRADEDEVEDEAPLDDDDEVFVSAADEDDDEDDEDDEELFDLSSLSDEDDDDDEDEEDDEEPVQKSQKDGRRAQQSASITDADQATAHRQVKNAKNNRAVNNPSAHAARLAGHFGPLDDDEVDEGEDDWAGEHTGDFGTADAKGKKRSKKSPDDITVKSDDDGEFATDEDYGIPPAKEEFIAAILNSPYAADIDSTPVLREVVGYFGDELARERAVIGEVVKSFEEVRDISETVASMGEDIAFLKESVQILAGALTKSLSQGADLLAANAELQKSLNSVGADVALVKSQPVGMTAMGAMQMPTPRPTEASINGVNVTKRAIHEALSKGVQSNVISGGAAADHMAHLDTQSVDVVYGKLPDEIKKLVVA